MSSSKSWAGMWNLLFDSVKSGKMTEEKAIEVGLATMLSLLTSLTIQFGSLDREAQKRIVSQLMFFEALSTPLARQQVREEFERVRKRLKALSAKNTRRTFGPGA
jgi:polyhydroxyalkanoate synthesis regulator phasin